MTNRLIGLLWLGALSACGGSSGPNPPPPPPPPPGVATVEVAPATPSVFTGDTVRLAATARTGSGAEVTGKTVSWSSGTPAVATVSSAGLVTALTAGASVISASVDGKTGTAQLTVADRVALDVAHRVSKPIGAAGDSLKTTGATGASYTLIVPPGALPANVTITMTPVGAVHGLDLSGGLLAAVKLEPAGTEFARPLELRIANGVAVPAGKLLIGFTIPDAGGTPTLLPAIAANGVTRVVAGHFSIVGLGAILPSELQALTPPNGTGGRLTRLAGVAAILAQGGDQLVLLQQLVPFFSSWFEDIRPILQASDRGDTEMLTAIPEYAYWAIQADYAGSALGQASLIQVPELLTKAVDGVLALAAGFDAAIGRANADCQAQRSLTKATLVLFWQGQAEQVIGARDLAVPAADVLLALGLDRASVLSDFCIQVVNTELVFPDPVTPGQSSDLRVRFGVKFGTDPNLMLPPHVFDLQIGLSGTTADGQVDVPTAADGRLTFSVVPTGQTTFRAGVKACADVILVGASDVCTEVEVLRPFGRTIIGNVLVQSVQGLQGISDVARIQGSLTIAGMAGNPIPNLDALVGLQEVTGTVSIFSLPDLTTLSGLRNLRTVENFFLSSLPKLATVDGLDNLRTIPGTLTLNLLPLVPNLQGLAQLLTIGAISLSDLPLVSSLGGLHQTRIQRSLALRKMDALATLAGPSFDPAFGDITIRQNPVLANLGGLGTVTSLTGSLNLESSPSVPLAGLGALTVVEGDVRITGPTLTSLAGLVLQRIGGELAVAPAALPQMATFRLPTLTELRQTAPTGRLSGMRIDLTGCNTAPRAPMTIDLPALTTMSSEWSWIDPSFRPLGCVVDINVPTLTSTPGLFPLIAVRTLHLGAVTPVPAQGMALTSRVDLVDPTHPMTTLSLSGVNTTPGSLTVGYLPNLQTLTLTGITVEDLRLIDLPRLTSMAVSGRVNDEVVFSTVGMTDAAMIAVGVALGARAVWKASSSGTVRLFP